MRAVRRRHSRRLGSATPELVHGVARELRGRHGHGWVAWELIREHAGAFRAVGAPALRSLGRGIEGWGDVDAFARILAGPAWLRRQVPDALIHGWARSPDRWLRRAALVSTVALNQKSDGGAGDPRRTLRVCRGLVGDRDDMVEKAMSWALRQLSVTHPEEVRRFLDQHGQALAARVRREVDHKLRTGLKSPRRIARPIREVHSVVRDS